MVCKPTHAGMKIILDATIHTHIIQVLVCADRDFLDNIDLLWLCTWCLQFGEGEERERGMTTSTQNLLLHLCWSTATCTEAALNVGWCQNGVPSLFRSASKALAKSKTCQAMMPSPSWWDCCKGLPQSQSVGKMLNVHEIRCASRGHMRTMVPDCKCIACSIIAPQGTVISRTARLQSYKALLVTGASVPRLIWSELTKSNVYSVQGINQGKTPWVDSACADHPGFLVPGGAGTHGFQVRLGAPGVRLN